MYSHDGKLDAENKEIANSIMKLPDNYDSSGFGWIYNETAAGHCCLTCLILCTFLEGLPFHALKNFMVICPRTNYLIIGY